MGYSVFLKPRQEAISEEGIEGIIDPANLRDKSNAKPGSDYDLLVLKRGVKKQRLLTQKIYLSFKDVGAPIDVIVADLDKYENLKTDPYMIYTEADKNGRMVYEKS